MISELCAACISPQYFHVDFVPGLVVHRTNIAKKTGNDAVTLRGLQRCLEIAIAKAGSRGDLAGGVSGAGGLVSLKNEPQGVISQPDLALAPVRVENVPICPTIRHNPVLEASLCTEIRLQPVENEDLLRGRRSSERDGHTQ